MASRRNRIIYASQSVHVEGRILYRVQTLGSSTTFNTTDIFELGQLNLTDVVDDNPEVAVTLDTNDYGSIYTMATLAKVPTSNLHHNIRQSDGVTFFGTVSGSIDVTNGDLDLITGLPALSGTGKANIVIKDKVGGTPLAYAHGVQLIDFGRECGINKGVDIYSPIQSECALGTSNNDVEFTKLLRDVFINSIEFSYQATDVSTENYAGETEQKQWFLNSARFLSWEEWRVGNQSNQIAGAALASKNKLVLSLPASAVVATLEDKSIGFLKRDLAGRPAVIFQFTKGDGLDQAESKSVPVFDKNTCTPSTVVEYFLYEDSTNELQYYNNGIVSTLSEALPALRSNFILGDKIYVFYCANEYAVEIGGSGRPVAADSNYVSAKYFAPISSEDAEDLGAVRQGQIEAYLVDPDLIMTALLTGGSVLASSVTFNNTIPSQIDLARFIGLKLRVKAGPGKNGPSREIVAAVNNVVGNFNNGTLTLGGAAWSSIRLHESDTQVSTVNGVFVSELCGIDSEYVGSAITVIVAGLPETVNISSVNLVTNEIVFDAPVSAAPDAASEVLVSVQPTLASEIIIGDYELALRLQSVSISASLTREQLKEIGHLNPYARTLTLPIAFTVAIESTASDLETFAKFSGKGSKYADGSLTDLDVIDLLAKDNITVAVMVYQQTDQEAGGTGLDRKVLNADMFSDEYFVNGVRNSYGKTDGSFREYPLKTVIVQNLRITDEATSTPISGNATQSFSFRGTNQVTQIRGYLDVDLVIKAIESQGD